MWKLLILLHSLVGALALGQKRCVYFPAENDEHSDLSSSEHEGSQRTFKATFNSGGRKSDTNAFIIASSAAEHNAVHIPVVISSHENPAVHIAARNFVDDIEKVTGIKLKLHNDTAPDGAKDAIVVGTIASPVISAIDSYKEVARGLKGKWESWDVRVVAKPGFGLDRALVMTGSDRRGAVYALYDLAEQLGISPFHYFADVPAPTHHTIAFNASEICSHGEPSVKYRGLFINDELPVLWNWIRKEFDIPSPEPPFQDRFYEKVFEFVLRMKGNFFWPAMWAEKFYVDGLNVTLEHPLPSTPIPGPNPLLADRMGMVIGTSHHEPLARQKQEWDEGGQGDWDWTNKEELTQWWEYGVERAKDLDTLYTIGMRGDGDEPLHGASKELLQEITAEQREILKRVHKTANASSIPQLWAMYKEVQGYFADGLEVPDDVTILLADDNYGNLMAVKPWEMEHSGGAGIYYHADYVGHPRNYRWMNTNSYAKMWEQLNLAYEFNTTQIWILNVGSMKFLELPMEWFLSMAYDRERWGRNSISEFLRLWAAREFGDEWAEEVGDIAARYSKLAGLMKHELLNPETYSLINYNEVERNLANWTALEHRATKVLEALPAERHDAFVELVWTPVTLVTNLNRLHAAVGRNNLYALQTRTSANREAKSAIDAFERDYNLTQDFYSLHDGKWEHMLDMTHIGYPGWNTPQRDVLPGLNFVDPRQLSRLSREGRPRGQPTNLRVAVENSYGAWPGTNERNCPRTFNCPSPRLYPQDRWGVQSRWIDIASGGPKDVSFELLPVANSSWLKVHPERGTIKGDGSADVRCVVSVDWDKLENLYPTSKHSSGSPKEIIGAVTLTASDGTVVNITVPAIQHPPLPEDFGGHVQGDGYVVMEAAHFQSNTTTDGYSFEEIEWYGRGLSGMEMYPATNRNFTLGSGPHLTYDFWWHGDSVDGNGTVDITVQIGPTLNFIIGKQIAFGLQVDDQGATAHTPVPTTTQEGQSEGDVGSVPFDWADTVKTDVRNVTLSAKLDGVGKHTLTVWGMSAGIVFERLWVDCGGIRSRGYSLLGPPESTRIL